MSEEEPPRPLGGCLRRAVLALGGALVITVAWEILTWPAVGRMATTNPEATAFLARAQRQARRAGRPEPRLAWVPYERISPHLKRAVLVGEDIDFFSHHGFAWGELENAWRDWREEGKRLRGASTLSQQLAKNLWLSPSRNPWRKVKEALLTWQLERALDKRRILELYLNVVEFGPGVFGAENAARHYFGTSAAGLGPEAAAALAAALPNPDAWHPGSGSRAAANHRATILRRMGKAQWLWGEI